MGGKKSWSSCVKKGTERIILLGNRPGPLVCGEGQEEEKPMHTKVSGETAKHSGFLALSSFKGIP